MTSLNFSVGWDHRWIIGTPFEEIDDLVLYDFAIHWFDLTTVFFGDRSARKVSAATARAAGQRARPPMMAGAIVEFDVVRSRRLPLNGDVTFGQARPT